MSGSRVLVALRVDAPPERTFTAFTAEIATWWRANGLFDISGRRDTWLRFEPDPPAPAERLVEVDAEGERFEIGRVTTWDPPAALAFGWRQASFPAGCTTEVSVRFDEVSTGTRVTVEHTGWDAVPQEHAARHNFPLGPFQQRLAEWWQALLRDLAHQAEP